MFFFLKCDDCFAECFTFPPISYNIFCFIYFSYCERLYFFHSFIQNVVVYVLQIYSGRMFSFEEIQNNTISNKFVFT